MTTVSAHFVTFFSPGTFVAEERTLPIDGWDTAEAMRLADSVSARYGATPYGFRFTTRSRGPDDLDSTVTAASAMHFLGGKIETLEEVRGRATKDDEILLWNMEHNDIKRIITNENSWRATLPLSDDDLVLDYTPPAKRAKST